MAPPAADAGPVLLDVAVRADDEFLCILQQYRAARPVVALDKDAAAFLAVGSGTGPNGGVFAPELSLRFDVFVAGRRKNGAVSRSGYRLIIMVKVSIRSAASRDSRRSASGCSWRNRVVSGCSGPTRGTQSGCSRPCTG